MFHEVILLWWLLFVFICTESLGKTNDALDAIKWLKQFYANYWTHSDQKKELRDWFLRCPLETKVKCKNQH